MPNSRYAQHLNDQRQQGENATRALDAIMKKFRNLANNNPVLDSLSYDEKHKLQKFLNGRIADWKTSSPDNITLMSVSTRKKYTEVLAILQKLNKNVVQQRDCRNNERRMLSNIEQQLSKLIAAARASEQAAANERQEAAVFRDFGYTTFGDMQSQMRQEHEAASGFRSSIRQELRNIRGDIHDVREDIRDVRNDVNSNYVNTLTALGKGAVVLTGAGGVLSAALPVAAATGGVAAVTGVIAGTTLAVNSVCTWMNIDNE